MQQHDSGPAVPDVVRRASAAGVRADGLGPSQALVATGAVALTPGMLLHLQRVVGNAGVGRLLDDPPAVQRQEVDGAGEDQYVEVEEPLVPDMRDSSEQDLPAQYVGDESPAAPGFLDAGRVGTARYGDPIAQGLPRAFTDGGQTGTVAWAGGGGAGAHGNQPPGSIQTQVSPVYFQVSPRHDAYVKEGTGLVDVTRSWTGVNGGDQGNGQFLTAAAAARINVHETLHVANSKGHYTGVIDPLLKRIFDNTLDRAVAQALKPPAAPRSVGALSALIRWADSIRSFTTADDADNKAGGTVDTNDLASGTYPVDAGPGTVGGKAFQHRVRTPSEPNPA